MKTFKAQSSYGNLYSVSVSGMVVVGLLFGFVFNAPVQYCCNNIRIAMVGLLLVGVLLTFVSDYKNKLYFYNYTFVFTIAFLGLISLNITTMPYKDGMQNLYAHVSVLLGFFAFRYYEKFKKVLLFLIYINFIVMVFDVYSGEYLFNFDPIGNYYQNYRGKGLFSYSKEAGSFMIFAALIFKNNRRALILIFISSLMSGSRSALFFVFLLVLIELFYEFKKNLNIKKILVIVALVFIVSITSYIYLIDHPIILGRLEGSFNFSDTGTHGYRFFIWEEYLNVINNFNILHILFGNLAFVSNELGNGAENAYLTILSNGGFLLFIMIYVPILFLTFLSIVNFYRFYPFILLLIILQFGRQGLGWSDGILFWAYIFYIYNSEYFKNIFRRMTGGNNYEK